MDVCRRFVKWVSHAASRLIFEHWWRRRMKRLKHSKAIRRLIWQNSHVLCFHAGCTNSSMQQLFSLSLCFCFQKKETCCLPGMNTVKHDQTMLPRLPMFVRRSLFVDQLFAACFWLNASKCRLEKDSKTSRKIRKKFRSSRKKCVVDCRKKTAPKERCIHTIRWGTYTREFKRSKTE